MASYLWWKGRLRMGSGSEGRRPHVVPRILDKKVSAGLVLRAGLRTLVVARYPVRSRPRPPTHRGLRSFPRRARRAGDHPRQDRSGNVAAPDGAVACWAEMVRGGRLTPCGDRPCRSSVQCPVGRSGSLGGRVGRLDGPFLDVLHPTPHPRLRWHLGGAGLERLCPAAPANCPCCIAARRTSERAVALLAAAADGCGGGPLV